MGFAEMAALRKKSRDLKNELKQLKKDMIAGGCSKDMAGKMTKELQEILELAEQLSTDYVTAREELQQARRAIEHLLDTMGESPAQEVKEALQALEANLNKVYHECSIRVDDLDFKSTMDCFKRMVQQFDGTVSIMLRSELENIKAVLDDAAGWMPPDFAALAYFFLHEDRESLKEMENEQRNQMVEHYFEEHFYGEFRRQVKQAGVSENAMELIQNHTG